MEWLQLHACCQHVWTRIFACLLQGISNEVEPYFGINKFQLGRLLRARLQQRLRSNAGAMTSDAPS